MTKTAPVQTLLDLSQLRLDQATRTLGSLISGEQAAADQHKVLVEYRAEYHARFMAAAQNGIDRDSWRNYQAFLDRLDASIANAEEAVRQSRQRKSVGQQEWLGKKERLRAFDTLAHRHHVREQMAALSVEQKSQDEMAAQPRDSGARK